MTCEKVGRKLDGKINLFSGGVSTTIYSQLLEVEEKV